MYLDFISLLLPVVVLLNLEADTRILVWKNTYLPPTKFLPSITHTPNIHVTQILFLTRLKKPATA
jgi:hypothetical protein